MKTHHRFPIFVADEEIFDRLWKKVGSHVAAAANLPIEFKPLYRHAAEFGAKCCGSTNRQRLFAEVASTPPAVSPGVTRQEIARQFESAIIRGAGKLANEGVITLEQAKAIADAAPSIVQFVSKDLHYLAVDRLTFERNVLDPLLVAARAPRFEYAIAQQNRAVFFFADARKSLLQEAGQESSTALSKVSPDRIREILRSSTYSLFDALKQGRLPMTHQSVVLSDEDGHVVGVSFQHPGHLGIVPVCCRDEQQFFAVASALYTETPAQNQHPADWPMGADDLHNIRPYWPNRSFPSMFNATRDDDGPAVYFNQVTMEKAVGYLADLAKAVNGARILSEEPDPQLLKGASLSSATIGNLGSQTSRTYWGLQSFQSQPGQSKVMSASGTTKGIHHNGRWTDQWYLRQIYWLDESSLPELGMPSDHFLAPRPALDITKVIPDGIEDFTRQALEHVSRMSKEQKSDSAVRAAVDKLQAQKKLLQEVKDALEAEAYARIKAHRAGLVAIGSEVLPPV